MKRRDLQRRRFLLLTGGILAALVLILAAIIGRNRFGAGGDEDIREEAMAGASEMVPEDTVLYKNRYYRYNSHLRNYLFMGIDRKGDLLDAQTPGTAGQSDALFLLSYDHVDGTLQALSIPRDTITTIETYSPGGEALGVRQAQITLQYSFGDGGRTSAELTRQAVSNLLFGLPVDGYTAVDMDAIPEIVALLGDIPVVLEDDSLAYLDPSWTAGTKIILTETNIETFVRSRDNTVHHSAMTRMDRQKVFLKAAAGVLKEKQARDPHTVTDLYEGLKTEMVTNMSNDLFADLAGAKLSGGIVTIPGTTVETDHYDEYHPDNEALYDLIMEMFYVEAEP